MLSYRQKSQKGNFQIAKTGKVTKILLGFFSFFCATMAITVSVMLYDNRPTEAATTELTGSVSSVESLGDHTPAWEMYELRGWPGNYLPAHSSWQHHWQRKAKRSSPLPILGSICCKAWSLPY